MATELPVRVQPVTGAQIADFPWATAGTALDVIDEAATTLSSQLDVRATMGATLGDWEGRFREEFDSALGEVTTTANGLKESLQTLASSIVDGADEANRAQRIYNNEAVRRQSQIPTP